MADLYKSEYSQDHDIPLAHLDYPHIDKCNNLKELEKILKVLRSGDEGRYPHLEEFCEKKIELINPKSRVLRKSQPVSTPRDVQNEEWSEIEKDLKDWQSEMKQVEQTLKSGGGETGDADPELPPVRSSGASIGVETKQNNQPVTSGKGKKKRVKPRDYREWDKIDIDAELEKVDNDESVTKENKSPLRHSSKPDIPSTIESSNLTDQQKIQKAEREKEKGNEAFRSSDFTEALVYYNRSLSLIPTVACRNNRAQTYIKLERWDEAIKDCSVVLKAEPDNMKALLRRGVAHQGKRDWSSAQRDIQNVLKKEPGHKRAAQILSEVEKSIAEKKKHGRRMVIEEVEELDDNAQQQEAKGTKSASKDEKPKIEEIDSAAQEKTADSPVQQVNESVSDAKPQGKKGKHKNKKKKHRKDRESDKSPAEDTTGVRQKSPGDTTKDSPVKSEEKAAAPSGGEKLTTEISEAKDVKVQSPPATPRETVSAPQAPSPPAPMPTDVESIKVEGNEMFKKGRYGEARDLYSKAIDKLLLKKPTQDHNLCLLYSNRGNCYTKMGDMENCAKDCNAALEINPVAIKPLVRRAAAYEAMDRYRKAYVDYRQVLYLDRSLDMANQGLNRCGKMLQEMDGRNWREKLPAMKIVSAPGSFPAQPATITPTVPTTPSAPTDTRTPRVQTPAEVAPSVDIEAKFEELKGKGNQCVQKGEFTEAASCYTECIKLFSNRTVPYTNRALCYLRLNKPDLVISDCTAALSHEPNNVKALFRRAQALKMRKEYTSSESDLQHLLKIDPKNAPAKRELQLVMNYITESKKKKVQDAAAGGAASLEEKRRQIEAEVEETRRQMAAAAAKVEHEKKRMKAATAAVEKNKKDLAAASAEFDKTKKNLKDEKKRCKIEIVETDESSDEEEEVTETAKVKVDMSKSTPIEPKSAKKAPEPTVVKEKAKTETALETERSDVPTSSPVASNQMPASHTQPDEDTQPASPTQPDVGAQPASPTGSQPTPYEFIHTWSTLKPSMGVAPYAKLLEQIDPTDIPKVISNKLDGDMLSIIIKCVDLFIDQGLASRCLAILQKIVSVPRFEMVTMFMTSEDKKELNSVLDRMAEWASCSYLHEDLKKLRIAYSLA